MARSSMMNLTRPPSSWRRGPLAAALSIVACMEPLTLEEEGPAGPLATGETRSIELRYLRLDVEGFKQSVSIDQLRDLPSTTLDELWLVDLELTGLVRNALQKLADLPEADAAELPVAAQNMRRVLRMTPDNANLQGTSLEELVSLSASVGIPPAKALSDILEVGVTERIVDLDAAAEAVVTHLVGSHPASQFREGPITPEHPDGMYPVSPGSMPITLGDVVSNFDDLKDRFGPAETEWGMHPGFIEEATGVTVIEDEFLMTVKVNANALPYKGADLSDLSVASVNSTGSQISTLFSTDDEDWLTLEGLVPEPSISKMVVTWVENDSFIDAGTTMEPMPKGNSPVWDLPPWEYERLVGEMAFIDDQDVSAHCTIYELGTGVEAFNACVDESKWTTFETFNDIGNPPAPGYLWDIKIEMAQVRLHDGGLAEGEADVQFSVEDVPVGITSDELAREIADNLAADTEALKDLASGITDNTVGEADFYYYKPDPAGDSGLDGDWLYFIAPSDIPKTKNGDPVRPYDYPNPGFFADAALTQKISDTMAIDGDDEHEKVRVEVGDRVFVQDAEGGSFEIVVRSKPSPSKIVLDVTRRG